MKDEYKLEELQKCVQSPYYFFTNHVMVNGQNAHTFLTEEEFNNVFRSYIRKYSGPVVYGK